VAVLPTNQDGTVGEATDVVQHHGFIVNPNRQQAPHAHMIITDVANQYAFVPDLGLDKIMIYEFDGLNRVS
jgi:6-phosphogluconolactonase